MSQHQFDSQPPWVQAMEVVRSIFDENKQALNENKQIQEGLIASNALLTQTVLELKNDLSAHTKLIAAPQESQTSHANAIAAVQATVTTNSESIAALQASMSTATDDVACLKTMLTTIASGVPAVPSSNETQLQSVLDCASDTNRRVCDLEVTTRGLQGSIEVIYLSAHEKFETQDNHLAHTLFTNHLASPSSESSTSWGA